MKPPILFLDLDNCLFDTRTVGNQFLDPIRSELECVLSQHQVNSMMDDMWHRALPDVLRDHGVTAELAWNVEQIYRSLELPETAKLYVDVPAALKCMQQRGWLLHLVTKGYPELQRQKITCTDLEQFFADRIHIVCADEPKCFLSKQDAFAHIITNNNLSGQEDRIIAVGDGAEELAAGHDLHLRTVQILRPNVTRCQADHHIEHLHNLFELLTT